MRSRLIALVLILTSIIAFALQRFALADSNCPVEKSVKEAISQPVGYGVTQFAGVSPQALYLGEKTADGAQKCVHVVVITNPRLACKMNRCNNSLFHKRDSNISLTYGQRGLLIYDCKVTDPFSEKGDLLTDYAGDGDDISNIALFQADQVGSSLWKQIKRGGEFLISLPTEGGESKLQYKNNRYIWKEFGGD